MQQKNQFGQLLGHLVENWIPCQRPAKTLIQGRYCILEPIEINKHAVKLFDVLAIDNQGESWTYLPYGPFDTINEFKNWLAETMSDNDTLLYAILDVKTKEPIGISGYLRMNPEHGVIEIGHLHFSALLKQTPLATEAIYLMLRHAFDELKFRRCEWKCNDLNEPSRRAAERFGFTFEGIFRQSYVFKNRNRDTAWFSMIDSEWEAIKEKFERWLHPNNFEANGKQILKLAQI
ncbi:MAG: GNAT family N-acetyltransferase [Gammaproteobacteria bacterium]|nr:GNAT family N-acetyltransferase [Gammaproteobacteria bacterium]MCW5583802.1 GNAT family N-acetyltransferase [Gammaproteobacteria bacterium]